MALKMETVATAKAKRRLAKREARLPKKRRRVNRLAIAEATRRGMPVRVGEGEASSRLPAGGSMMGGICWENCAIQYRR